MYTVQHSDCSLMLVQHFLRQGVVRQKAYRPIIGLCAYYSLVPTRTMLHWKGLGNGPMSTWAKLRWEIISLP